MTMHITANIWCKADTSVAYLGHVRQLLSELVSLACGSLCTAVCLGTRLLAGLQLFHSHSQCLCKACPSFECCSAHFCPEEIIEEVIPGSSCHIKATRAWCLLAWSLTTDAQEKGKKDHAFRRQFNEKPSSISGCPEPIV